MTEEEVKTRLITPYLQKSGWHTNSINMEHSIRQDIEFTDGRINYQGKKPKREDRKRYDYCLKYHDINLAIIEAKGDNKDAGDGIQQAMKYAQMLRAPFAYASNGKKFIEYDFSTGAQKEFAMNCFPSPQELYNRYKRYKQILKDEEYIFKTPYFAENQSPRYYQENAINATLEAVAKNQRRILLVMATGTGKTFTAFQIVYKLFKAKKVSRILYLADRNVLINQAMDTFKYFKKEMTKIQNKTLDSSYKLYFSLYQQLISYDNGEAIKHYKDKFDKDFFDLIIIDECHRGSANENSEWREILEYFTPSIQIGMTATPKCKDEERDNIDYFGEPAYVYSLRQGINDGFLAPYKVVRYGINIDIKGYRPEEDKTDKYGNLIPDKEYTLSDFDQEIFIDERTELVAKTISNFLKNTLKDRYAKTIVFCQNQFHASKMRQALINENIDITQKHPNYVLRITSDDDIGKSYLDDFTSIKETFPVIATTSKLLTTGVDTKMVKLIVIDSNIQSATEFKQIIGRGTRINTARGKSYFTILDFRGATKLFTQDDFDMDDYFTKEISIEKIIDDIKEIEVDSIDFPPQEPADNEDKVRKIEINGVECRILYQTNQILDSNGKLISNDFILYSTNNLHKNYKSLEVFLKDWHASEKKTEFFEILEEKGILIKDLRAMDRFKNLDEFDILISLAFNLKTFSRKERAKKANSILSQYEGKAREILEILLEKYTQHGISELENINVFKNEPFTESTSKIMEYFGGVDNYNKILREIKHSLYQVA